MVVLHLYSNPLKRWNSVSRMVARWCVPHTFQLVQLFHLFRARSLRLFAHCAKWFAVADLEGTQPVTTLPRFAGHRVEAVARLFKPHRRNFYGPYPSTGSSDTQRWLVFLQSTHPCVCVIYTSIYLFACFAMLTHRDRETERERERERKWVHVLHRNLRSAIGLKLCGHVYDVHTHTHAERERERYIYIYRERERESGNFTNEWRMQKWSWPTTTFELNWFHQESQCHRKMSTHVISRMTFHRHGWFRG